MVRNLFGFALFLPAFVTAIELVPRLGFKKQERDGLFQVLRRSLYLGLMLIFLTAAFLPLSAEGWWLSIMVSLYALLVPLWLAARRAQREIKR